ncbi:uncharacterized protein CANTADRAFT_19438 [Suhomyces tanzawaensis NRRL Y-17324]|uniref:C2H2-type domain-containing protein n=1 Tax=Suhomyces tanzawaensis NRRL Y-17324 TaxID=984487 RepID=A0A1E4SQP7_9ASCO|nr:uncharacterized protein CANTADRAFT_19438 [Suhomyces tanzawaensis NRRL Y-17324]ODV81829.1 hypothetical protein CANTADRAFT_19438 [Suhomyces tanzawaensis NRRL Y-17324]
MKRLRDDSEPQSLEPTGPTIPPIAGAPIQCPDCLAHFTDYASFELHVYNHNFTCHECNKSFPSKAFLNLHIDENHNPFLKIKQERGEKIFKCFLYSQDGCTKVCSSPKKRRLHMIDKHGYPKTFHFEVVNRGMK